MFCIYCCKQKFFLKEQIKKKINNFLNEVNNLNYLVINDNKIDNIVNNCLEVSLFGDKKVIVVDNASFLLEKSEISEKDVNILNKFLSVKNNNIIVFFLIYEEKINFNKKILKNDILKNLEISYFRTLDKNSWLKYVQTVINEKKINIEFDAILELADRTTNDYNKLFNEIEKIFLCERKILLKDIFDLISRPVENNVFDLLNALLDNNIFLSLQIFYDLIKYDNFNNNFSIFLLNVFAKQVRFFYLCDFLFKNGNNVIEIANKLKANKIRVKIVLKKTKKIKNILNILDDIYEIDFKIKSSQIDKKTAIEFFIINFSRKYLKY